MKKELMLAEVAEPFFRNPTMVKTAEGELTEDTAAKWAWLAHGYDTGMEPFYSADQLKEAMRAAWDAAIATNQEYMESDDE